MGSSSRVRPSPRPSLVSDRVRGRKSATAAAMTRTSAAGSAASTAARMSAVVGALTRVASAGKVTDVMPWTSVTLAPRATAAAAMATPIRPVERLPMKRTGSMGSAVPPAVTTTCHPARSWAWAGSLGGGHSASSG